MISDAAKSSDKEMSEEEDVKVPRVGRGAEDEVDERRLDSRQTGEREAGTHVAAVKIYALRSVNSLTIKK